MSTQIAELICAGCRAPLEEVVPRAEAAGSEYVMGRENGQWYCFECLADIVRIAQRRIRREFGR